MGGSFSLRPVVNMDLSVRTLMGSEWEVRGVDGDMRVSMLKRILRSKCGIAPSSQALSFRSEVLQDRRSLESYGIESGSTLQLVVQASTGFKNVW